MTGPGSLKRLAVRPRVAFSTSSSVPPKEHGRLIVFVVSCMTRNRPYLAASLGR
jgi:hypothetical protein